MKLTRRYLKTYLEQRRIVIPETLKKELLEAYGHCITDDEGHVFEYSEQDVYEQIRKIIQPYEDRVMEEPPFLRRHR